MRTLKFRAWTHQKSPMQWSQKAVAITGEGEQILPVGGTFTGVWHAFDTDDGGLFIEQYIGLKDKNGKEIYEGDIVTDALGNKHTVEWDDEEVRYYFQPVGSTYYYDRVAPETTDYSTMEGRWSVIGNIHENPELL